MRAFTQGRGKTIMTEEEEKKIAEEMEGQPPIDPAQVPSDGVTQAPDGFGEGEPQPEPEQPIEPEPIPEPEPAPRTFTQEEVNALLGKTRQEARQRARDEYANELRERYGVDEDSQIDELIGNGQRFDALNGEYESQSTALNELKSENALLRSGIPEEKFNDVKAILAYSGLEVTPENIARELETHPEWVASAQQAPQQAPIQPPQPAAPALEAKRPMPQVVQKLGGEPQGQPMPSEEERARIMREAYGR